MNVTHHFCSVNQITLHVVMAGPADGPPVLLLHGFPEFWYGWRAQIAYLADQGFRVIVPDQRGYNLSDKPTSIKQYDLDVLASDVISLIDYLGLETAYLAAHDWGAIVAWWVVQHYPARVRKLAILNVPHPSLGWQEITQRNWRQALKSWYILFFQLPGIPELMIRLTKGTQMDMLAISSQEGTFQPDEVAQYHQAWMQPGARRGMINWYRALVRRGPIPKPANGSIETPTIILWGEQDIALELRLAERSVELLKNGRLITFPNATHWVQHDEAAAVNHHLATFFSDGSS